MAANIFLTGATGYLGGEVLYQITQLPAKHRIRCLVRTDEKAKLVQQVSSNIETVKGDLEDTDLITKEASTADIVLHLASTRHEPSTRAILTGLSNPTSRKPSTPGYWLQIGGASMFAGAEIKSQTYGTAGSGKTYDDVADITEIRSVIRDSLNRVVDNLAISQDATKIRSALVPGPIIYGKSRGPGNTTTIQGPAIADYTLKHGTSFTVNQGENVWSTVHVGDVAKLFALLVTAAASGDDNEELWNDKGIFFPENGRISFHKYASQILKSATSQSLISSTSTEPTPLTPTEVDAIVSHGSIVLGTNARVSGSRAKKHLGWEATGISLEEEIPLMVKGRAEVLGKSK